MAGRTSYIRIAVIVTISWYAFTTLFFTIVLNRGDIETTTSLRHDVMTATLLPPRRHLREEEVAAEALTKSKINKSKSAPSIKENGNDIINFETNEFINTAMNVRADAIPPQCDKLPLVSGRHFFRNRLRVVDQDLTDICGPKVMIIGSMKCGTNKLAELLLQHPRIKLNSCNLSNTQGGCNQGLFQAALKQGLVFEGNDFTHIRRDDPDGWLNNYGKRLPLTDGISTMTFDKSPSYMDIPFFPDVAKTARKYLPNVKIVATLCNPAERLFSELNHLLNSNREGFNQFYHDNDVTPPADFSSFVDLLKPENPICNEKNGFCESNRMQYLKKGEFLNNLRPWYEEYGEENVLLVDMSQDPTIIVENLLDHVGSSVLPISEYPWEDVRTHAVFSSSAYEGRSSAYQYFNEDMKWLERYYEPHNDELASKLGKDWPRKWSCRLNGNCD